MFNIKRLSIIAGVLIVVGLIGSLVSFKVSEPLSTVTKDTFDSETISHIVIETINETIEVLPNHNDTKIKVEIIAPNNEEFKNRLTINQRGDTLTIKTKNRNKFFNLNFFQGISKIQMYLPEKIYESIKVESVNGDIKVNQVTVNDLNLKTTNGGIDAENIKSENVFVATTNGNIRMTQVDGNLAGKTINGLVYLKIDHLDRSIHFETTNGDIEIVSGSEPTNSVFDIRTGNGEVNIFNKTDWDVIVGKGEHIIKLRTNNGNIKIND